MVVFFYRSKETVRRLTEADEFAVVGQQLFFFWSSFFHPPLTAFDEQQFLLFEDDKTNARCLDDI
jgi:hypothetical protein